jgi:hypothetical protein
MTSSKIMIATFPVLLGTLISLSGCSEEPNVPGPSLSISDTEIREMNAVETLEGASVGDDLETVSSMGSLMPASQQNVRIVGRILDVLPPEKFLMEDFRIQRLWVPVRLSVEQGQPDLTAKTMIVRLFPSSELSPDFRLLKKGMRVLAVGTPEDVDQAGQSGVTLGWFFEITDSGDVRRVTSEGTVLGKFNDYAEKLSLTDLNP